MLTNEQIAAIDQFCQKKGIYYYDLRQELVDHLAESIETKMQSHPEVSFETALAGVYQSFGIFGFSKVIEEREAAIRKATRRQEFELFRSYFTFPKIAVSLLCFLLLNVPVYLFKIKNTEQVYGAYCIFLFVFSLLAILFVSVKFKRPMQKLVSLKHTGSFAAFIGLFQLPNLYYNFAVKGLEIDINHAQWFNPVMTLFCTLAILLTCARYHAYKSIYNNARLHYPLAFER
ncbi:hypothetical protein A8C56_20255 [Niabella ginsenosidivorans]|uniref:Uncharacterized protein n=1 Tax=Niabella ginsenosidivorans TaxID=1176587 RepID=A0A1A9I6P6_9BACT|nr:hypothetical protein [Niabella ginsenosidivorans]ANH83005.1 hypothetical protein A8C56_20255 [Niabella ginsenosidivorans]